MTGLISAGITYEGGTDKITITGYNETTPCTFDDIYTEDQAQGWGQVSKQGTNQFKLDCDLQINTWLADTNKEITVDKASGRFFMDSNGVFKLGTKVSDYIGTDGCTLLFTNPHTHALYFGSGRLLWYDSVIDFDNVYLGITSTNANEMIGCILKNMDLVRWKGADSIIYHLTYHGGTTYGLNPLGSLKILEDVLVQDRSYGYYFYPSAGDSIIKDLRTLNVDTGLKIVGNVAGTTSFAYVIDSVLENWDSSWSGDCGASKIYRQYSFDLKVVDKDGVAINGSTVQIWDKDDNLVVTNVTDVNGSISTQTLNYGYYNSTGGSTPYTQTPHTLKITAVDGEGVAYNDYETQFDITAKTDWSLTMVHPCDPDPDYAYALDYPMSYNSGTNTITVWGSHGVGGVDDMGYDEAHPITFEHIKNFAHAVRGSCAAEYGGYFFKANLQIGDGVTPTYLIDSETSIQLGTSANRLNLETKTGAYFELKSFSFTHYVLTWPNWQDGEMVFEDGFLYLRSTGYIFRYKATLKNLYIDTTSDITFYYTLVDGEMDNVIFDGKGFGVRASFPINKLTVKSASYGILIYYYPVHPIVKNVILTGNTRDMYMYQCNNPAGEPSITLLDSVFDKNKLDFRCADNYLLEKYSFDLKVTDKEESVIVGASITIKDQYNNLVSYVDSEANLAEVLDKTETGVDVTDSTKFTVNDIILIDGEYMQVTNIAGNTLTVTRNYYGTNYFANIHPNGKDMFIIQALTTNESGETATMMGFYRRFDGTSETETDYSPHTLKISHQDYPTREFKFTLDKKIDWTIALSDTPQSSGMVNVYGTEYAPSEEGTIYAQVLYGDGSPANSANCNITIFQQNTTIVSQQDMTYISGSDGSYYYNFTVPSNISVFMTNVKCSNPTAYGSGDFHVSTWARDITQGLNLYAHTGGFYSPSDKTVIYATTTDNQGALINTTVNVEIFYPNGTSLNSGQASYYESGRANYTFTLPSNAPTGTYRAEIDSNYSYYYAHETLAFLISPVLEDISDVVDYINTTITNTIIPYLQEINQTTHNSYNYLQNTIYPKVNEANSTIHDVLTKWGTYNASELYSKINDTYNKVNDTYNDTQALLAKWGTYTAEQLYNISNATYISTGEIYSDMATTTALSSMQTNITWLINNVATQTNITLLSQKLDTINSTVNTIKNQTDCSTPANSELCTYLNSINTTVNTIYSEMATQENISAILSDTNWLVSNVATQENITETLSRLTTINNTINSISSDLLNINSSLQTKIDSIQTDIDWLESNVATQTNITEIITRLTEINSTTNEIDDYLDNDITNKLTEINTTTQNNYDYLQNTVFTKLNETWNNTQQTLTYIGNPGDDENQNTLFGEHQYTQNRVLEINGNLTEVKTIVTQINITTEAINSTVSTILLEVDDLEELHQCSISPNSTICSMLSAIKIETNNIYTLTAQINTTTSSMNLLSISTLTAGSPRYANEEVLVEVTFSGQNGSYVTPDTISLTIYDPNDNTWDSAVKADFTEGSDHIWQYSKSISANPTTGMYTVHMQASYQGVNASRSAQFRIATGGPYKVYLECPDSSYVGQNLVCSVILKDEGEVPTESTSTVWVDLNNNGAWDAGETQVSFSKQTVPLQNVTQSISLNVPSSYPTGLQIVRVDTSYASSSQPNSGASDSVTFSAAPAEEESPGGKAGKAPTLEEEVPEAEIEVKIEEGEIKIIDYPKRIEIIKAESLEKTIGIKNIGESNLNNVQVIISGLSLDSYTIFPEKYEVILPQETKTFTITFRADIEAKEYKIKFIVTSDEGSEEVDAVLAVKEKVPVPSYLPWILIILIVSAVIVYFIVKKKIAKEKHKPRKKITLYKSPLLNAKNIIIAVLVLAVLVSILLNISIKEILSKIINFFFAIKLPSMTLNWWFVLGGLLILLLAGMFIVLILILKEIRKLTAGKRLKPQYKTNKKILLIIGIIVLIVLFLLMLILNPSITGNAVGVTNGRNGFWLFGFILIIGIIGLLIFISRKKDKEILQEVRNAGEKPVIEKKSEVEPSHQDAQNLQSAGFKIKPNVKERREKQSFSVNKETSKKFPVSQKSQSDFSGSQKSPISVRLEKMQGLDKPAPNEIRTNVYKTLEENGIDVGNSLAQQKVIQQITKQAKSEIQAKRISAPTNKQDMLNQLKEVYQ